MKEVWKPDRHTFAGGFAVGSFITVQLLPIQMPSAVILAGLFRVNIPIALILCWFSNPFTVPFIIYIEHWIGSFLLELYTHHPLVGLPCKIPGSITEIWSVMREHIPAIMIGGIALGVVLAILGYSFMFVAWDFIAKYVKTHPHQFHIKTHEEKL
jgi:hypothetical protein